MKKTPNITPTHLWMGCLVLLLLGSSSCTHVELGEVLEGKNGELFQMMYVRDFTGERLLRDYDNEAEAMADARQKVEKTVALVDSLQRHGKTFLFLFAPTKTATYPEYLPKDIRKKRAMFSLEEYYIQLFKEKGIPHIDFYTYFQSLKHTYPYPLFSPIGSHWAQGVMPLVGDTILRKLEELSGLQLPSIKVTDINLTTDYTPQDSELERMPNAPKPRARIPLPKPICTLTDTIGKDRPYLLVVGDGNYVELRNTSFVDAFAQNDYWLYNRDIKSSRPNIPNSTVEYSPYAYQMLEEADIVLGIMTAPYFYQYFFEFEQTAFKLWQQGPPSDADLLRLKMEAIRNNPDWYQAIVNQAKERGISAEENLKRNALYVLNNEKEQQHE
ncbi:MAG: hypothetical protein K6G25_01365 [Bacteroidales bacterium]|nr:hypothetical protein [Bacteroidales bacterium]